MKINFLLIAFLASLQLKAQKIKIPMEPKFRDYDTASVQFIQCKGEPAVAGKNGRGFQVFLKSHIFTNGTI